MSRLLDLENFVAEKLAWHQRIASDPTVSLSAKAVAGFILHDLNASEGGAWRGQESMAAGLGVSARQLRRLLDELEVASYLQVEVRKALPGDWRHRLGASRSSWRPAMLVTALKLDLNYDTTLTGTKSCKTLILGLGVSMSSRRSLLTGLGGLVASMVLAREVRAQTSSYSYDVHGRLIAVTRADLRRLAARCVPRFG